LSPQLFLFARPNPVELGQFVDSHFGNLNSVRHDRSLSVKSRKKRMVSEAIQPPSAANVGASKRARTSSEPVPETIRTHLEPNVGKPAAEFKNTLHFEKSDEDSQTFKRVAELAGKDSIRRARTAEEMYKSLLAFRPEQIVINCASCRKEGFQLLEDLREIDQLNDIPIVVLSDRQDEATIRLAFALGATRVFLKPILLEEYKQCLSAILSDVPPMDQAIARFEKFPPLEPGVASETTYPPKYPLEPLLGPILGPIRTCSLISEKQPLKRYPWTYHRISASIQPREPNA
jgi:CheY-like chemotaxis protein